MSGKSEFHSLMVSEFNFDALIELTKLFAQLEAELESAKRALAAVIYQNGGPITLTRETLYKMPSNFVLIETKTIEDEIRISVYAESSEERNI